MKLKWKDTFQANLFDKGSVKILDEYIKSKKQYFFIDTCFDIIHLDKIYRINFIISNKIPIDKTIISTNITMTEFKKLYGYEYCDCETLINYRKKLSLENRCSAPKLSVPVLDFLELFYTHFQKNLEGQKSENDIIFFDNPISINAQSSSNRTGYGNEYYYNTLIYEGTKYGETSQFPIIGYIISFFGEIKDNVITYIGKDGSIAKWYYNRE